MKKINFEYIKHSLNADSLGSDFYRFLSVHTSFLFFSSLPNVFINTFLMSQTGNMDVVLIYNMLSFIFTAVGMFISADVVHRFNPGIVSVLGIIGFNLLYLQLIFLNTRASDFVLLLGITNGLASSFYWISYSQLLTDCTDLSNRDTAVAIVSIMCSVINSIVPFLAGIIISTVGGFKGYETVFGIAFIVAVITCVGAMRLPRPENVKVHVMHKKALQILIKNKVIFFGIMGQAFTGIREGAYGFILTILLYKLIQNEALVGFNTLLSSVVAIISFTYISKRITRENRVKHMNMAVWILIAASILCAVFLNPAMVIIYTIINSFFAGFIVNSSFSTFMDSIQILPVIKNMKPEYFALKEVFLATGRCSGILLIKIIDTLSGNSLMWVSVSLIILTATQFGTAIFCRKAMELTNELSVKRSN